MANSNFVVHNGLTVGQTTITASTGNISTTNISASTATIAGNLTISNNGILTLGTGKTFAVTSNITLAGTDGTIMTFPTASANIGYLNIPQNSQSAAYTTVMSDSGKHIFHPSADTTARVWTIASNANVAYPIGTAITFINQAFAGTITLAIAADVMRLAGPGTTGNRTLTANGIATATKITSTEWIISGAGLT